MEPGPSYARFSRSPQKTNLGLPSPLDSICPLLLNSPATKAKHPFLGPRHHHHHFFPCRLLREIQLSPPCRNLGPRAVYFRQLCSSRSFRLEGVRSSRVQWYLAFNLTSEAHATCLGSHPLSFFLPVSIYLSSSTCTMCGFTSNPLNEKWKTASRRRSSQTQDLKACSHGQPTSSDGSNRRDATRQAAVSRLDPWSACGTIIGGLLMHTKAQLPSD